jgi:hypothetical protein
VISSEINCVSDYFGPILDNKKIVVPDGNAWRRGGNTQQPSTHHGVTDHLATSFNSLIARLFLWLPSYPTEIGRYFFNSLSFVKISCICETSEWHMSIGQTNNFHSRPIFTKIVRVLSGVGFQMFSQCIYTGRRIFRVEYWGCNSLIHFWYVL